MKKFYTTIVFTLLLAVCLAPAGQVFAKQLLTKTDFTYLGGFAIPGDVNGEDPGFGKGLSFRYVNGQPRLFSSVLNSNIYEINVPTNLSTNSTPVATVAKVWGSSWANKAPTGNGASWLYGLYWDETDKRLYWSFGDPYNASNPNDASMGYGTINDSSGTLTPVGYNTFSSRGPKSTMGGVFSIPQWFANQYLGGKRLAACCGGYFSIITVGDESMGPALTAFNPPAGTGSISSVNVLGYPFTQTVYGTPERVHRNTNYSGGDWLAWPPQNGIGYWTAGDNMGQAGVWVDTQNKTGLIYFPTLTTGLVNYVSSSLEGGGSQDVWMVYNPDDLVQVINGQKQQWQIQPQEWTGMYPGLSNGGHWRDLPDYIITGATFDPTANRLYVGVEFAATGGAYGEPKIFVWQVNDSVTPPPSPTTKTGDLNSDGKVDIFDYNILVGNFGKTGTSIAGDIDANGKVDIFDYNALVGNFGK